MYILVNEKQIEITSHKVKRFTNDGHLLLTVFIPKENMTGNGMDALCDDIEENAPAITVYESDGEIVQTMTGFKIKPTFRRTEDGTAWELNIENASELEYQYGRLQDRAAALEKLNKEQAQLISKQAAAIDNLNSQLLVVQLAAAELYEKSLQAEATEETTEEPAEESTVEEVEESTEESEAVTDQTETETETEPVTEQEEQ